MRRLLHENIRRTLAIKFADRWIETSEKMALGLNNLISAGEIDGESTEKLPVFREDKMTVYHYKQTKRETCARFRS